MEQLIIFVYDTEFCQTEADDPQKAVLFFHPHWVSDQQRLALCGQLMGATHFCSTVFSPAKVLTLQCGKFVLNKFGRYIVSVGSDQTLPEWILQERLNLLKLFFQFYHNTFDSIYGSVGCDQESFSKKLNEILAIYIPILQYIVCAVGNIFVLRCPKNNSAAFLEAFQLLEGCCNFKGVLGGVVLQNSKVIASQLDPELTKLLSLSDRFHIHTQGEPVNMSFALPVGGQLLRVFLKRKVFENLQNSVNFKSQVCNGIQKKVKTIKTLKKRKDLSKIFTVHEEESNVYELSPVVNESFCNLKETIRFKLKKSKPKIENKTLKERSKSFVGGLNIKVCSTPTVEKTLIHEELVSICNSAKSETQANKSYVPDVAQDTINLKRLDDGLLGTKYSHNKFHRISMDDLMIDLTHKTYPIPLKYFCFGLPRMYRETEISTKDKSKRSKAKKRALHKTIADPMNPVFRFDGLPVSKSLYSTCLDDHYKDFIMANITIDSREEFLKKKNSEEIKTKCDKNQSKIETYLNETNFGHGESKASDKENLEKDVTPVAKEKKELTSVNQKAFRRSLSLPLKPLLFDSVENTTQNPVTINKVLHNRTPTTPLTTKFSLLAFEEQLEAKRFSPQIDVNHFMSKVNNRKLSIDDGKNNETVKCNLLVFGEKNMTIMLITENGTEVNQNMISSLLEISSTTLKQIENLRNKSMANISSGNNNNASYSFLMMEKQWGTVQKSGSWGDEELKIVGTLQHDLDIASNMTEVIVRNEDSVVYGYNCGGNKIFYQQGGVSSAGLPTPADLMGSVTLKARRRLERDRDIILL